MREELKELLQRKIRLFLASGDLMEDVRGFDKITSSLADTLAVSLERFFEKKISEERGRWETKTNEKIEE